MQVESIAIDVEKPVFPQGMRVVPLAQGLKMTLDWIGADLN